MSCLKLTLRPSQTINKAVIPAAGFGTRLFPATKATKKELFPVIDQDGIAKPAILLIVEEALSAGLENVVIIVQEHDLPEFQSFFNEQITMGQLNGALNPAVENALAALTAKHHPHRWQNDPA